MKHLAVMDVFTEEWGEKSLKKNPLTKDEKFKNLKQKHKFR